MKLKRILSTLTASIILTETIIPFFNATIPVRAASYNNSQARQSRKFQLAYRQLDSSTKYDATNLFTEMPNFGLPFNAGTLQPNYIFTSMSFINYYRSLFALPPENNYTIDNQDAQIGASCLAAVNAKTSLRAHGLLGYKRPKYISKEEWAIAEEATLGNINFLESTKGATAGEIVTDLLRDEDNIAGVGDTGHRALLISARATHIGIGAAYGQANSKFYSVENGIFADDILRSPVKSIVTYPSNNVFPYELVGNDTPWSIYFGKRQLSGNPKVYITDLTTGKKYQARRVRNFGTDYYSDGFTSALSFYPSSKTKLINTHEYRVQVGKIYHYRFRLFREKGKLISLKKPKKINRHHRR